jgi:chromosome segregation ATPase
MKIEITNGVETPVTKFFSTTPETDVAEYYIKGEGNYVRSDISRKLERERGEANTKLQEVSSKLAEALRERDEARVHWGTESMNAAQFFGEKTKAIAERDEAREERDWAIKQVSTLQSTFEDLQLKMLSEQAEALQRIDSEYDKLFDEAHQIRIERDEARELAKEADLGHDMAISDLTKCETELAEATTKLAQISSLTESIIERANELIARWDQPSWKDTAPTARFINALRIAVRAYERGTK